MVRVQSVPVFVADQERALAFYCDVLGFRVLMDVQMTPDFRWLVVAPPAGGTEIILYCPAQSVNGEAEAEIRQRIGIWTGIILLTDDIEATHQAMAAKGANFVWGPRRQPWGAQEALFTDVDGNQFHLVQRPEQMSFAAQPELAAAS